jgi:signal transduction histidine kinase
MPTELEPAILQTVVTVGLATVSWLLFRRYRTPYYAWWTVAWLLYSMRLCAIMQFLVTRDEPWLYWHQVLTGWTAVALLLAAFAFVNQPWSLRRRIALALFPPVWSYLAIYSFDSFLLAAIPAVLFLAGVTLWTGWVFFRHWRRVHVAGAAMLAGSFTLWGIHHLDYPFLRGRGAWIPWGYYMDIIFTLAVGAGMLMLVVDEMLQGLKSRSDDLQRLSIRMIQQHEEERRRVSLELHDETAQVFSTVKLQLGLMRETADPSLDGELARALTLIDKGIRSIRNVTNELRPSLLDDLGLIPAMRSLVVEFAGRGSPDIRFIAREPIPEVGPDAELALFRALQELLSNVGRHAQGHHVDVLLSREGDDLRLVVEDDGVGIPPLADLQLLERLGHVGLAGIRERITTLGGDVRVGRREKGGTSVEVRVPIRSRAEIA